ncbi:hypothetical protein GEMRC1_001899 [Eukaryota sp. GEM-RC1]
MDSKIENLKFSDTVHRLSAQIQSLILTISISVSRLVSDFELIFSIVIDFHFQNNTCPECLDLLCSKNQPILLPFLPRNGPDLSTSPLTLSANSFIAELATVEDDANLWKFVPIDDTEDLYALFCVDLKTPLFLSANLNLTPDISDALQVKVTIIPSCRLLKYTTTVQIHDALSSKILVSKGDNSVCLIDSSAADEKDGVQDTFIYNNSWCLVPDLDISEEDALPNPQTNVGEFITTLNN